VGSLFLAGILPGALMAILMMITVAYFAHKTTGASDMPFNWPRVVKALAETAVVIGWPVCIWLLVNDLGTPAQLAVFAALFVYRPIDSSTSKRCCPS
jgi:TRAP-type C4-dicarboxylate transport system permease large subunit